MKTIFFLVKSYIVKIVFLIFFLFILISCNEPKETDSKAIAKALNVIKFDDSAKGKDSKMMVELADFFLKEIYIGQLAQQKSTLTDVKALGKMISVAENKFMTDLIHLTESSSISLPDKPSDKVKIIYKNLNNLTGIHFEKSYCDLMVTDHKAIIVLLKKLNLESSNHDFKIWASGAANDIQIFYNYSIICQQNCDKL